MIVHNELSAGKRICCPLCLLVITANQDIGIVKTDGGARAQVVHEYCLDAERDAAKAAVAA